MSRGNRLLFAHRYSEAIAAYDERLSHVSNSAFLLNKGSALLDSGRYAEADLAYGQYLFRPRCATCGRSARRAATRALAHGWARSHCHRRPLNQVGCFEEGEKAYKAGRYEEALQDFEKSYELNPLADTRYNQPRVSTCSAAAYAAAERYGQYLAEKPDAKDAAKVGARIEKLLCRSGCETHHRNRTRRRQRVESRAATGC